jgi:hypothetical protein
MTWAAIAQGLGSLLNYFGGKSNASEQNRYLRESDEADRSLSEWELLQQLLPELSRQQALDPVRNATIADIGAKFFPGIDPSTFAGIRDAGPRSGLLPPPSSNIDLYEWLRRKGELGEDPALEGTLPVTQAGMRRPDGLPRIPAPPPPSPPPAQSQAAAGGGAQRIQLPRF